MALTKNNRIDRTGQRIDLSGEAEPISADTKSSLFNSLRSPLVPRDYQPNRPVITPRIRNTKPTMVWKDLIPLIRCIMSTPGLRGKTSLTRAENVDSIPIFLTERGVPRYITPLKSGTKWRCSQAPSGWRIMVEGATSWPTFQNSTIWKASRAGNTWNPWKGSQSSTTTCTLTAIFQRKRSCR